jgi:gas vesicle protein
MIGGTDESYDWHLTHIALICCSCGLYRCPERAIDTHIYQAWRNPDSRAGYYNDACNQKSAIAAMERDFGPIVVGEWSLATDNCAMWLNGFNDNLPGFPRLPCKYIPCADPYMGNQQPGAPVDPQKPMQGPYGTGMSGPSFGFCPVDRDWPKEQSGNPQTGRDWVNAPPKMPKHLDDTDNVMSHLARKKINAFSGIGHGFYFWNFRTDLDDPQWSYLGALARGWIPTGNLHDESVVDACRNEDLKSFKCILKRNTQDDSIRAAVHWINDQTNITANRKVETMSGDELRTQAEIIMDGYYQDYKFEGVNCDFGGIGLLVEENRTITDDDFLGWDDDEYIVYVYTGPSWWMITLLILVGTLLGTAVGFIAAMRFSKKFNKRVRESKFFKSTGLANNSAIRKSLALPQVHEDLSELEHLYDEDEKSELQKNGKRQTYA